MVIAVFDLCDTLCDENTTVGFLRFLANDEPAIAKALDRWLRQPVFFLVGAVAQRLGRDLARERLVASLKGFSKERLEAAAAAYARHLLAERGNAKVLDRLQQHRDQGDRVAIISSSLAPIVEAVAEALGVEGHGSSLGFDTESRCTGLIVRDLTGAKAELATTLRAPGERLAVYTDNRTDLGLLRLADEGVVILPPGRERSRWAGNGVSYVEL